MLFDYFILIIIICIFVLKILSANCFLLSYIQGFLLIQLHSFKVHNIVLTRNYVHELIDSLVLKTSKLVFWCVFKDVLGQRKLYTLGKVYV